MPKKSLANWDAYVQVNLGKKSSKAIQQEIIEDGYPEYEAMRLIGSHIERKNGKANQIMFWGCLLAIAGVFLCAMLLRRGSVEPDIVWGALCLVGGVITLGIGIHSKVSAGQARVG